MNPTVGPNKTIAAGASGAATVVLIWIAGQFGLTMPPEVASAATTLIASLFVWFTPHGGA